MYVWNLKWRNVPVKFQVKKSSCAISSEEIYLWNLKRRNIGERGISSEVKQSRCGIWNAEIFARNFKTQSSIWSSCEEVSFSCRTSSWEEIFARVDFQREEVFTWSLSVNKVKKSVQFLFKFSVCFTSTETIRTIRDGEPRKATSTFTQLLISECVLSEFSVALQQKP